MQNLNRRSFLATSLGATSAWSLGRLSLGDDQGQARIPSSDAAKFKFSLAAYSYRDLLTGDSPQLTLFDFINDCAKFGTEGWEEWKAWVKWVHSLKRNQVKKKSLTQKNVSD